MIKVRLYDHLVNFELINNSQHGFMTGKSCLTNLLDFMNFAHSSTDKGEPVDAIYLNFQKAFDKVPHQRLMPKLNAYGIGPRILSWIGNWLNNRSQRVVLNGSSSRWSHVDSGVPKGPFLDLCYF